MGRTFCRTPTKMWSTITEPHATITTLGRTFSTMSQITTRIGLWCSADKTSSLRDRTRQRSRAPVAKVPTFLATKKRREEPFSRQRSEKIQQCAKETKKHSRATFLAAKLPVMPTRESRGLFRVQCLAGRFRTL